MIERIAESLPLLDREAYDFASLAAESAHAVLLQGETGTGKTQLAEAIHRESARADGAFAPVNCAAIAAALFDSEMFGHRKGAFTGATATRIGLYESRAVDARGHCPVGGRRSRGGAAGNRLGFPTRRYPVWSDAGVRAPQSTSN